MSQKQLEPDQIITAIYQSLLGRRPDVGGLSLYSGELGAGYPLQGILNRFLDSSEFQGRYRPVSATQFPLDDAPKMAIETGLSSEERRALWDHVSQVWSSYGEIDPFWSVLTDERWRSANMTDDQMLESFYATGETDGLRLDAWLRRNGLEVNQNSICAEYGCGVGRITHVLARQFRHVLAFDISQPHLEAAARRFSSNKISNVEFVLVRDEAALQQLSNVDVFYSVIVLQHNPPPIMIDILNHAFAGLRPGGLAFFQMPTYSADYSFSLTQYWDNVASQKTMEMHFLPQHDVLKVGRKHGVHPVEVQPDWCVGHIGEWISNTFLMRKAC